MLYALMLLMLGPSLLAAPADEEPDITGKWVGYLDQTKGAEKLEDYQLFFDLGIWEKGMPTHYMELTIRKTTTGYEGEYYVATNTDRSHYGRFRHKAEFNGKILHFKAEQRIEEVIKNFTIFCFCEADLKYSVTEKGAFLKGDWTGWMDDGRSCAPATIILQKVKE